VLEIRLGLGGQGLGLGRQGLGLVLESQGLGLVGQGLGLGCQGLGCQGLGLGDKGLVNITACSLKLSGSPALIRWRGSRGWGKNERRKDNRPIEVNCYHQPTTATAAGVRRSCE